MRGFQGAFSAIALGGCSSPAASTIAAARVLSLVSAGFFRELLQSSFRQWQK
jgi:hypothetical protein